MYHCRRKLDKQLHANTLRDVSVLHKICKQLDDLTMKYLKWHLSNTCKRKPLCLPGNLLYFQSIDSHGMQVKILTIHQSVKLLMPSCSDSWFVHQSEFYICKTLSLKKAIHPLQDFFYSRTVVVVHFSFIFVHQMLSLVL